MRPAATSRNADLPIWIRQARPNERLDLEELQRRAALAVPDYREQLKANPEAIQLPMEQICRGHVIVAEAISGVAGFAAVLVTDEAVELAGLFVEPDSWGRGVGSALVEEATHVARRAGFSLTVIAAPTARGFYEKCGFSIEGETQTWFGPALSMSR